MSTHVLFAYILRIPFDKAKVHVLSPRTIYGIRTRISFFPQFKIKGGCMTNVVEEVLLTRDEAANYIGRSVSTLYTWEKQETPKVKHVGEGEDLKYRKSDCDEYCNELQRI